MKKSSRQDEDDGTERILCKFAWEKQVDWAEKKEIRKERKLIYLNVSLEGFQFFQVANHPY